MGILNYTWLESGKNGNILSGYIKCSGFFPDFNRFDYLWDTSLAHGHKGVTISRDLKKIIKTLEEDSTPMETEEFLTSLKELQFEADKYPNCRLFLSGLNTMINRDIESESEVEGNFLDSPWNSPWSSRFNTPLTMST